MRKSFPAHKPLSLLASTLTFVTALSVLGCGTEDPAQSVTPPTQANFQAAREAALERHAQRATFKAEEGITFVSDDGATVSINANCVGQGGEAVSGDVELTFVDLYGRKDMVATDRPTMGLTPDDTKALLTTGGEFLVEVSQGGTALDATCPFRITVPGENTHGADQEMSLWNGTLDANGDLTWAEAGKTADGRGGVSTDGADYTVITEQFGWTNIDKFRNDDRAKTTMRVKPPEGFDYTNSAVYLSYDGEPNALAKLDTFASGIFSEHYGQIPIGLQVHLIFATVEGTQWRYAVQAATITEDALYTFNIEDTQVGSLDDLVSTIAALP